MRAGLRRNSRLKGRQPDAASTAEVRALIGECPPEGHRRDLLIEYLHLLNDAWCCLHDRHLVALAREMRLPMAEVFEVASFYHHF
ncbi:MAG: NAD(P)H-dependent oxidoreductase subunit E, partial [Burkholderiales bacterium]|nr:NAD(P)H-dependent oxidoreductase subunit E [Burkholderiales bacterium]